MEGELEEERKQKANALSAKKKLEMEFNEIEGQIDAALKGKEDALKQLKKAQVGLPSWKKSVRDKNIYLKFQLKHLEINFFTIDKSFNVFPSPVLCVKYFHDIDRFTDTDILQPRSMNKFWLPMLSTVRSLLEFLKPRFFLPKALIKLVYLCFGRPINIIISRQCYNLLKNISKIRIKWTVLVHFSP